MNAVVAERPGKLSEVLSSRAVPLPGSLAEGEVAVRIRASTVNPSDAVTVSGAYRSRTEFPFVPGFEGIGVIERAGPGVPDVVIGTRVLPIGSAGAWQQVKITDHDWCVPVPEDLSDAIACFSYINPLTAFLMVQRHCSGTVRNVAMTAASSTIATQIAELLNLQGIHPVGIVRGRSGWGPQNPERWRSIIDTSTPGWEDDLLDAAGPSGFDVIFDCVGGPQGLMLMRTLTSGGLLVHYGLLSGEPLPAECFTYGENKRVEMFRLRDTIHAQPRESLAELFAPVFDHLRQGRLGTRTARHVALADLPMILREDHGQLRGKTLISYPE